MLRARLERRGEGGSHAWLAAIAGPGLERASAVPITAGTSATAAAAVGVGAMATKLVVGAAVCALLAAYFLTRPQRGPAEGATTTAVAGAPVPSLAASPQSAMEAVAAPGAVRSSALREEGASTPAPAAPSAHDGPVLRVRVVDTEQNAVAAGVLSVCPDRMPMRRVFAAARPFVAVPIAGAFTDVPLPKGTRSATVTACSANPIPSRPTDVLELGELEVRELSLEVGRALTAPSIAGRVLVDGVQRVPSGLSIQFISGGSGLVHALDATWAVESVPEKDSSLVVTSDETVLARIEPKSENLTRGRLDLELSTGRTLVVKLVDRVTGRPHADSSFVLRTDRPVDGRVWDSRMRVLRTDGQGTCRTTGIPLRGGFSLLPDLDPVRRGMVLNNVVDAMSTFWTCEPWYSRRVAESDPEVVELELRVDIPTPGGSAFGFVPAHLRSSLDEKKARLVSAEVTDVDADGGDLFEVPRDTNGRWTLSSHWPSRHFVWIQDVGTRAALTERVEVASRWSAGSRSVRPASRRRRDRRAGDPRRARARTP